MFGVLGIGGRRGGEASDKGVCYDPCFPALVARDTSFAKPLAYCVWVAVHSPRNSAHSVAMVENKLFVIGEANLIGAAHLAGEHRFFLGKPFSRKLAVVYPSPNGVFADVFSGGDFTDCEHALFWVVGLEKLCKALLVHKYLPM